MRLSKRCLFDNKVLNFLYACLFSVKLVYNLGPENVKLRLLFEQNELIWVGCIREREFS